MPKVSVIIPVYNVEKFLRACLDSVCAQTFTDFEAICINDCSTDSSLQILNEYSQKDKRFIVQTLEKNSGASTARNAGLEIAQGEYVYFLDSDDYIEVNTLEQLFSIAHKNNLDGLYFNSKVKQMGPTNFIAPYFSDNVIFNKILTGPQMFLNLVENNSMTNSVCRQFWKKSFLIENSLFFENGLLAEDALFGFKTLLSANKVMAIDYVFHTYIKHPYGISQNKSPQKIKSYSQIFSKAYDFWRKNEYSYTNKENEAIRIVIQKILNRAIREFKKYPCLTSDDFENISDKFIFETMILKKEQSSFINKEKINKDFIENISKYKSLYIYGGGYVAEELASELIDRNVHIMACVETSPLAQDKTVCGLPVMCIDAVKTPPKDTLFLIGTVKKHHDSIIEKLTSLGYNNYIKIVE